jgi:hypothetical protein
MGSGLSPDGLGCAASLPPRVNVDARGRLRCMNDGRKLERGDVGPEGEPSGAPGELGVGGLERAGECALLNVGGGGREM